MPGEWEPGKAKWQGLYDSLWLDPNFERCRRMRDSPTASLRTGPGVNRCCLYRPDWHLFYEICGVEKEGTKTLIDALGLKPWVL